MASKNTKYEQIQQEEPTETETDYDSDIECDLELKPQTKQKVYKNQEACEHLDRRRPDAVRSICALVFAIFVVSKLFSAFRSDCPCLQLYHENENTTATATTATSATTPCVDIDVTIHDVPNPGLHSSDQQVVRDDENHDEHADASNSDGNSNSISQLAAKTPMALPLEPPYRIIQIGVPRSGSTFQFHLLDAIAQLKMMTTQSHYDITFKFIGRNIMSYNQRGPSFVLKSHAVQFNISALEQLQQDGEFVIFTSGLTHDHALYPLSLYNQNKDDLEECPLCEVDHYSKIFGLNETEVAIVKDFMHYYSIIRQCCGLQMSQYEIARLNGCDVTTNGISERVEYPHCDLVDKAEIEQNIVKSPIHYQRSDPQFNWAEPGDCARFDAIIANGNGFNGKPYNPEKNCPN